MLLKQGRFKNACVKIGNPKNVSCFEFSCWFSFIQAKAAKLLCFKGVLLGSLIQDEFFSTTSHYTKSIYIYI